MADINYNYLANQIVLLFEGGRPTVEGIDVREVEAWVKAAHATIGRNEYFENYKADNQSTVNGQWLVTYQLPVNAPDITGYKYVALAENFLNLPKNRGIVRVAITDPGCKIKRQLPYIGFENYENLRGGSTLKFTGKYFYSVVAKKVYLLPACNENVNIITINVTQAVANDATLNESHTMLIVQQVMPLMMQRFGRKADMVTDANPNAS